MLSYSRVAVAVCADQHLPRCTTVHIVWFMTSAYEGGRVPEIQVRHRLRIAREAAGLEQEQLANNIGVSRNTISNYEHGNTTPRRIVINAWALACGVPVSWIQTGKGPPGETPDGGGTTNDQPTGWRGNHSDAA